MPEQTKALRRTSRSSATRSWRSGGGKDLTKLREVVETLVASGVLEERLRDHALTGGYKGTRECHVEPDWLLIYEATDEEVILIRTGTHADLFGK